MIIYYFRQLFTLRVSIKFTLRKRRIINNKLHVLPRVKYYLKTGGKTIYCMLLITEEKNTHFLRKDDWND